MVFNHCVQYTEQFPHASHHSDFTKFSGFNQTSVERFDQWIKPDGRDYCHVSSGAYNCPTTPDTSLSAHFSAITIERGYAAQRRGLFAVQPSQLREVRQNCDGEVRPIKGHFE
jgi:hypothetical protein